MKNIKEARIGSYCISCLTALKSEENYIFYCKAEGCPRFGLTTRFCYDREFIKSMESK